MTHVDLMRPAPGWQRCCMCFNAFRVDGDQLYVDPDGQKWDVCVPCAAIDAPTITTWPVHDPPEAVLRSH